MTTIKQKKAVKEIMENRGNISKAMLKAGYTPATAKNPRNLTESKGWNELMDKYLPDKKLLKKHDEALDAIHKRAEITDRDDKGRPIYEYYDEPDQNTRLKAVELGYRVKKKLSPEIAQQINVNNIIQDKKDKYGI